MFNFVPHSLKRLVLIFASTLFSFIAVEYACYHYLRSSVRPPQNRLLIHVLRAAYHSNRAFVQYDSSCARYDTELAYTLRPGTCTFSGPEFSAVMHINSLGLRDDEDSLNAPEIVVLGDSHAMGWGVNDSQTFPSIIEEEIGVRVLNTAISSYGTARETMLLKRLDLRRVRAIVIQYCSNDWIENDYVVRHAKLDVLPESRYKWLVEDIEKSKHYRPGQYFARMVEVHALRRIAHYLPGGDSIPFSTGPSPRAGQSGVEADRFLSILQSGNPILARVPLIVFEVNGYGRTNGWFINDLASRIKSSKASERQLQIMPIDLSDNLTRDHFFTIDDHLNANGHRYVANRVISALRRISG